VISDRNEAIESENTLAINSQLETRNKWGTFTNRCDRD